MLRFPSFRMFVSLEEGGMENLTYRIHLRSKNCNRQRELRASTRRLLFRWRECFAMLDSLVVADWTYRLAHDLDRHCLRWSGNEVGGSKSCKRYSRISENLVRITIIKNISTTTSIVSLFAVKNECMELRWLLGITALYYRLHSFVPIVRHQKLLYPYIRLETMSQWILSRNLFM